MYKNDQCNHGVCWTCIMQLRNIWGEGGRFRKQIDSSRVLLKVKVLLTSSSKAFSLHWVINLVTVCHNKPINKYKWALSKHLHKYAAFKVQIYILISIPTSLPAAFQLAMNWPLEILQSLIIFVPKPSFASFYLGSHVPSSQSVIKKAVSKNMSKKYKHFN